MTNASPLSTPRRSCSRATSLLATMAALALLGLRSSPAAAANALPDASFGVFHSDPVSGQTVRLVSYACDPDGYLFDQAWDLDGDGFFDDAFGREVITSFGAGSHTVGCARATRSE